MRDGGRGEQVGFAHDEEKGQVEPRAQRGQVDLGKHAIALHADELDVRVIIGCLGIGPRFGRGIERCRLPPVFRWHICYQSFIFAVEAAQDAEIARVAPRRRAQRRQLFHGGRVPGRLRKLHDLRIHAGFVLPRIDHLRRANIRVEQVRPGLGHVHAQDRTPGTAHQDDFILAQVLAQIAGNGDAVVAHLFHRQADIFRWPLLCIRHARATLVPLHQRVVLFPAVVDGLGKRTQCVAGAAMDEEDHGIAARRPLDRDPLRDAVDGHVALLVHRLFRRGTDGRSRGARRGRCSCLGHAQAGEQREYRTECVHGTPGRMMS
ncbi:hypothetical protein D3C81_670580 [compost metagenome]